MLIDQKIQNQNMNEKAFLIGNGINRAISNGVRSWEDLLDDLAKSFNIVVDLKNEFKPFPLAFEEILFKCQGDFDNNLINIKKNIASVFLKTPPNEIHERLVLSGIENILTTNYDYAFEKVLITDFKNDKGITTRSTEETLNSIKRRTWFKKNITKDFSLNTELSIWHIHGEINQRLYPNEKARVSAANSIMIGYEHYGSYLVEIEKYLKGERGSKDKYIIDKIQDINYKPESWIDFFFMRELHIAGISFDFSEHHLWWILNYRAKLIKRNKITNPNSIFYYYDVSPDIDQKDPYEYHKQLTKRKVIKAKIDLFESLGVKAIPININVNDFQNYYEQIFNKVIQ